MFSEKPANSSDGPRCVNFITAAGGLLQAVVFGYGGLRLQDDRLEVSLTGIPGTSEWAMYDLRYRGFTFDLHLKQDTLSITVSASEEEEETLTVVRGDGSLIPLQTGKAWNMTNSAFSLSVRETSSLKAHSHSYRVSGDILLVCLLVAIASFLH